MAKKKKQRNAEARRLRRAKRIGKWIDNRGVIGVIEEIIHEVESTGVNSVLDPDDDLTLNRLRACVTALKTTQQVLAGKQVVTNSEGR